MDTCVICGEYVPEGRQVCMSCCELNGKVCYGKINVSDTCANCQIAHDCLDNSNLSFNEMLELDNKADGMLKSQLTKMFKSMEG